MIQLEYQWDLGLISRFLGAITGRARNLRPVLEGPVATILQQMNQRNFESEGAQSTPKWPPLSPDVAARPRIAMLRVTDRLFRSLTSRNADAIIKAGEQTLEFGTRVPWAIYHRFGTRTMPKRQPVPEPTPASDEEMIRSALQRWVIFGRLDVVAAR